MDVMNICKRNVADVSCFLLFEATGDSDMCDKSDPAIAGADSVALDEDDAESCSWDLTDQYQRNVNVDSLNGEDDAVIDRGFVNDHEEEDEATSSDPVYEPWSARGRRGGEIGLPTIGCHKSSVSVDSTTKEFVSLNEFESTSLNEMEKDRLFWETCLAS